MMYSNNFAAALLVNGKVLREFGDTVYLPFGCEYVIRLKNLNSSRAKVHIEIDGEDVTEGGLVVDAFGKIDLERFIRNGNLSKGNRFKFIERTANIENYRGSKAEDGIISIRYEFEITKPTFDLNTMPLVDYKGSQVSNFGGRMSYRTPTKGIDPIAQYGVRGTVGQPGPQGVEVIATNCSMPVSAQLNSVSATAASAIPANETGITVAGSVSNQSFGTTHWRGSIGGTHVLNIRLLGETEDNRAIRQPVTVKTKQKCPTCGTMNKATAKFCSECGTSLQVF